MVHAGKVLGEGDGTDDVCVDIALLGEDVMGLTIAASTDGAPFGEITDLQWCVFLETGETAATYRVEGLTTERALVLGELYRRAGCWRLRAVGQGWDGGLPGLATDYGVSIAADKPEPVDDQDFDVEAAPTETARESTDVPAGADCTAEPAEQPPQRRPSNQRSPTTTYQLSPSPLLRGLHWPVNRVRSRR